MAMQLHEFTGFHDNDPSRISRIRIVVADHADPTKRKEWIDALISVDLPTVRNGALLRAEALEQAIEILRQLAADLKSAGRQSHSGP
jgi:hypothetical protein